MIRGIIKSITSSAGKIMRFSASGRSQETISNREFIQHYGFCSVPPDGAECVILREGNIIYSIADCDRRYVLSLEKGETAIFALDKGKMIFKKNGDVVVTSGAGDTIEMTSAHEIKITATSMGSKVVLDATTVELGAGAVEAVIKGTTFQALYNTHTHTGGFTVPTSPPVITASALSTTVKTK